MHYEKILEIAREQAQKREEAWLAFRARRQAELMHQAELADLESDKRRKNRRSREYA